MRRLATTLILLPPICRRLLGLCCFAPPGLRRHTWVLLLLCLLGQLSVPLPAYSQDSDDGLISREYPLKALFIYNFASYIEWPANVMNDVKAPFTIGVLGSSPIDETLNQIAASKQIAGRKIAIVPITSFNDIKLCQILFVAHSVPMAQQQQAIEAAKNRPILLVGESEGFANLGGDVNFFVQSNRIRFEINLEAMRQQELKASSKLLAMAKIVEQAPAKR
jgi:uncharacterized protein DUF4154